MANKSYGRRVCFLAAAAILGLEACQFRSPPPAGEESSQTWVSSWISAQQVPEPRNALSPADLENATLRQIIRTSLGGRKVRVRISNVYGTVPLTLGEVSIARSSNPASSSIEPGTSRQVTFSRQKAVTIPAGAYMVSDPVAMCVDPLTHLAVSMHYPSPPAQQTGHPGSRATSYVLAGNHVARETLPNAKQVNHWYQLAGLDVEAGDTSRALVVIGDSITDGFGVQANTDQRWTDFLVGRIRNDATLENRFAVLNAGLGGNRVLVDGLGPNGLSRFDRDVVARPGASDVIVLLGVNDLGTLSRDAGAGQREYDALVHQLMAAYEQMADRARRHEIRIIGGTIMPFAGSSFYPSNEMAEAARQEINAWIRKPGNFDAVIDFDARMRSVDDPAKLNPAYDSGDHLHPSIAGYRAMAELVPLDLFKDSSE